MDNREYGKTMTPMLILSSALFLLGASATPAQTYCVDEIPHAATGINQRGHVVGNGYLWTPEEGSVAVPRVESRSVNLTKSLNNDDEVVGYILRGDARASCPIRWTGRSSQRLWTCSSTGLQSAAWKINDYGQIVGTTGHQALRFDTLKGTAIYVGSDDSDSQGYGVNSLGQWVGIYRMSRSDPLRAFRYTDGTGVEDLPMLAGGTSVVANSLNDAAEVVGTTQVVGGSAATLWREGGVENVSSSSTYPFNWGKDINNNGVIVGYSGQDGSSADRAFIVTRERGFEDLTDLVGDPEWVFRKAEGINDAGQIVGSGVHNGRVVGFRLTPCYVK